jgi:SAM-dependent methyltransferase
MILIRYREVIAGRALELGCGTGRVLGYLGMISGQALGIDVSLAMVERCRAAYPEVEVRVGDIAQLDLAKHSFDVIFALANVLDVFDLQMRERVLRDIRDLLVPEGLLIFSSHNLDSVEPSGGGSSSQRRRVRHAAALLLEATNFPPRQAPQLARRLLVRRRNRRRLAPLQYKAEGHAMINDQAHDFSLLHMYIQRDEQERQLKDAGYELLECLDVDGIPVEPGTKSRAPWLHYVAAAP